MRCRICDGLPPEHRPYVVWHTGWDGCEEHDRDYYDEGVVVCADCIEALRYAGIGLDGDACVIDLQCSVDMCAGYALARLLDAGARDRMRSRLRPPLSGPVREQGCGPRMGLAAERHMVRCGRVQGRFGFRPMPSFPDRRHGRACRRVSETRRWLGVHQHAKRTEACRTAGRGRMSADMSETDTDNTQIDKRVECVVLPGDRRSGISCDWANATKETDN